MPADELRTPDTDDPGAGHTADAFHRGDFWIVQPRGRGHRAGMDAMILAASVPSAFTGRLADYGAGAGAAGFAVAARCPGSRVTLVELSAEMAEFARLSAAHPGNTHLRERISIIVADAGLAGAARVSSGLADNSHDFVIMNPPFNPENDRPSPDELKRQAHMMDGDLIGRWLRSAAAITRPGGGLALIARPASLQAVLTGLAGRFGDAEVVPIHPRADAAAIRFILRARRAARGSLRILPPLYLHEANSDRFTDLADAIGNGRASLFGD